MALDGMVDYGSEPLPESYHTLQIRLFLGMHRADADSFASAFSTVFSYISEDQSPFLITRSLLKLRAARANFERTRERAKAYINKLKSDEEKVVIDENISDFNRLYKNIADSELLLSSWFSCGCDWSGDGQRLRSIAIGLPALFDPDCDVLVIDGEPVDLELLRDLGVRRVLMLDELLALDSDLTESSDNLKLDDWVEKINDLEYLPPRIVTGVSLKATSDETSKDTLVRACQAIRMSLTRILTTRNTLNHFGQQWVLNGIENIKILDRCEDFRGLVGAKKNSAALIVGPAPSLADALPILHKMSKHCDIICLSQALRALVDAGITPDIVIVTDALFMPKDFGSGLGGARIYAFDVVTDPRHIEMVGEVRLWPYVASEIKALALRGELGESTLPWLPSGGSVSHSAFSLAMLLGYGDIVFVGHDFCLDGDRQYASLSNGSSVHEYGATKRSLVDVETNDGRIAAAPIDYDMFRKHIEKMVSRITRDRSRVRTVSYRGAKIDGVPYVSLESTLDEFASRYGEKTEIPPCRGYSRGKAKLIAARNLDEEMCEAMSAIDNVWQQQLAGKDLPDGFFEFVCRLGVQISRAYPQVSLYMQKSLSKIDELVRKKGDERVRRFLVNEFLATIFLSIKLVKK